MKGTEMVVETGILTWLKFSCLPPSGNLNLCGRGVGINKYRHRWAVWRQSGTHEEHHVDGETGHCHGNHL